MKDILNLEEIIRLITEEIIKEIPNELKIEINNFLQKNKSRIKKEVEKKMKEKTKTKEKENIFENEEFEIHNRRYLGAKTKLLNFINEVVEKECGQYQSFLDLFGGTGVVANNFNNKETKIIINDLLKSNYYSYLTWFGSEKIDEKKLKKVINEFNKYEPQEENYFSNHYGGTFFSSENARKIGYIREKIEEIFSAKKISEREKAILVTSLIYALDKVANTCGHYDAFRKNLDTVKKLKLKYPKISESNNGNNEIYNMDSNMLVKKVYADIVYIDPPYNSRQYCDSYHLLENVAQWGKPKVTGKAKKMEGRSKLKSSYCSKSAPIVFRELIENIEAKYIIISYNNMGDKGNARSQSKISDKEILEILSKKGEVKIYESDFKYFTTGKSEIEDHKERLFVCKVKENEPQIKIDCNLNNKSLKNDLHKSPLNYTGGKYKLMNQFQKIFPENINTFVDMFCGGGNVSINISAKNIIAVDNQFNLIELFKFFQLNSYQNVEKKIDEFLEKYNLSNSMKNGYSYYNCDSSKGLGSFNKIGFEKLRKDFNENIFTDNESQNIAFFTLTTYAFNNQIRFSKTTGKYNLPVGKRDFNSSIRKKLKNFISVLNEKEVEFRNDDFRNFDYDNIQKDDLIYFDPPYLITNASYNENGSWTENEELQLLEILDKLLERKIKFALSNLLEGGNKENNLLKNWIEKNKSKIKIHYIDYDYKNSNYQKRKSEIEDKEILITNF